jgi:hypothetical protein
MWEAFYEQIKFLRCAGIILCFFDKTAKGIIRYGFWPMNFRLTLKIRLRLYAVDCPNE